MMSELNDLIRDLRDLLPNAYVDDPDPSLCFRACIERYLSNLGDNAELISLLQNMDIIEAYVNCCLDLFEKFGRLNYAIDDGKPVFSLFQCQQLSKCLEFVVCLGIYPLLSSGVSMPLHMRLEHFDKYKCPDLQNVPNKHQRLFKIAKCFDALNRSPIDALSKLITPNAYLGDYLAVLLQLSYGPVSTDLFNSTIADIIRTSRAYLRSLLARLPRSVAFKELFLFLAGFCKQQSPKKTQVPKWLRSACGLLITQLFIARPRECDAGQSSLKDLIVGVLDVHSTDPRHAPSVAFALARILATPPQMAKLNNTTDKYYLTLKSQISDALQMSKDCNEPLLPIIRLVAIDVVNQMFEKNAELGKQLFLEEPLLSKMRKIVLVNQLEEADSAFEDQSSALIDLSDALELLSAVDLRRVVELFTELLDTRHPSQTLFSLLVQYSQPWFYFYSLLNLIHFDEDEEQDCKIAQTSKTISVADFRSRLYSILTSLLNADHVCPLSLLRAWLRLPPLDPTTLKPLSSSSTLSLPLPLRHAIILRPASLVSSIDTDLDELRAPFRVSQAVEAIPDHSTDMVSARVTAAISLLSPASNSTIDDDIDDKLEASAELIISAHSVGSGNEGGKHADLASRLLLSLISDINSVLVEDANEQLTVCLSPHSQRTEAKSVEVPMTASLLASAMLEQIDVANLWPSDPALAVHLLCLTLSRLCLVLDSPVDRQVLKMETESLNLVLGIAAFFVNYMEKGDKVASEVRTRFGELIPLLLKIEATFPSSSSSSELAQQIRVALCTRGAFSVDPSIVVPSPLRNDAGSKRRLIEELFPPQSSNDQSDVDVVKQEEEEAGKETLRMGPKLSEVFKQLKDPLIPVQGHALIELSRLLEARDPGLKGFENLIYTTLVEHLDNEDSYIYLNVIRALSAIGNVFTDRLLPLLLTRFLCTSSGLEFRLKMGEAIQRILRELGEIAPKHRDIVVSGLFSAARDPSDLIRAASLSNLAEICRHLGSSIQSVAFEVYTVIENSLKHDSAPLVRKSAAYLARSLFLASVRPGLPAHLPAELIRDVHRLLRDRLTIERNDEVLEQLEAAMAELDARTRAAVFRPPDTVHDLVKEIRVLRPFDD